MIEQVGFRLQSVRKFYGWSQRELAKRAGVPNSAISVIEQGTVSPSVSSLERVLGGFPMSLVDFFAISIKDLNCIFMPRCEDLFDRNIEASFLSRRETDTRSTKVRVVTKEKSTAVDNAFTRRDELLVITEGELAFHSVNFRRDLIAGDSISIFAPLPYRIEVKSPAASWVVVTV